jgi:hypothetical protein
MPNTPKAKAEADVHAARSAYVSRLNTTADVIANDLKVGLVNKSVNRHQLSAVITMHDDLTERLDRLDADFTKTKKNKSPQSSEAALRKFTYDSQECLKQVQSNRMSTGNYISAKFKSCVKALGSALMALVRAVGRLISCLFSPITNLFKAKPKTHRRVAHGDDYKSKLMIKV